MKGKIYNYQDLEYGLSIIKKNPPFEPSKQGFIINVGNSFKAGKITQEEKDKLLKDISLAQQESN